MREQVVVGIVLMAFILVWSQKISWWIKLPWIYLLGITALRTFWPRYFPYFAPAVANLLGWNGTKSLLMMLVFPVVILNASDKIKKNLITFFKIVMLYDACVLLAGQPGMFEAKTFDASLIACLFLYWNWRKWYGWLPMLICSAAILKVHSRTAMLILAVMYGILVIQWAYRNINRVFFWDAMGIAAVGAILFAVNYGGRALIHDSRHEMWEYFMQWFMHNVDVWWGVGLGGFEWIGPLLDPGPNQRGLGYGFFVMHNDWLQIFFETGIIGTALIVVGYLYTAVKLRGKDLANWLGIGAGMVFYYVSHTWVIQILALILITRTRLLTKVVEIPETDPDKQLSFEPEALRG